VATRQAKAAEEALKAQTAPLLTNVPVDGGATLQLSGRNPTQVNAEHWQSGDIVFVSIPVRNIETARPLLDRRQRCSGPQHSPSRLRCRPPSPRGR
jgi:hypothetical protein